MSRSHAENSPRADRAARSWWRVPERDYQESAAAARAREADEHAHRLTADYGGCPLTERARELAEYCAAWAVGIRPVETRCESCGGSGELGPQVACYVCLGRGRIWSVDCGRADCRECGPVGAAGPACVARLVRA